MKDKFTEIIHGKGWTVWDACKHWGKDEMKPHMKVIQRNGVDIFVTSSIRMAIVAIKTKKPVVRCRDGEELFRFNLSIPPTHSYRDYMRGFR